MSEAIQQPPSGQFWYSCQTCGATELRYGKQSHIARKCSKKGCRGPLKMVETTAAPGGREPQAQAVDRR